jgi:hypothetical protein
MTTAVRYDALVALLALPDPIDLPARARHYVCAGDPLRRDQLKIECERAYLRHRRAEYGDETSIISVRRFPRRLVRHA